MSGSPEQAIRLKDLVRGPWALGAWRVFRHLRPDTDLSSLARSDSAIALPDIQQQLTRKDRLREPGLRWIFRYHGESPVRDQIEIRLRDSLDRVLETLTLVEIAVATGYLSVDEIRVITRRILLEVLWSEGVRKFIESYGYVAVSSLAHRVGLDLKPGFSAQTPTFDGAQMRFAIFLAQHQWWYRDSDLEAWLRFLDDYTGYPEERDDFAQFLKDGIPLGGKEHNTRFIQLLAGLDRFCTYVSDLAGTLREEEIGYFFVVYSYALARFIGKRLTLSGLKIDPADYDWSARLLSSPFARRQGGLGEETLRDACESLTTILDRALAYLSTEASEAPPKPSTHGAEKAGVFLEITGVSAHLRSLYQDDLANLLIDSVPGIDVILSDGPHALSASTQCLRIDIPQQEISFTSTLVGDWRSRKPSATLKVTSADGLRSAIVHDHIDLASIIST